MFCQSCLALVNLRIYSTPPSNYGDSLKSAELTYISETMRHLRQTVLTLSSLNEIKENNEIEEKFRPQFACVSLHAADISNILQQIGEQRFDDFYSDISRFGNFEYY